MSEKAAGWYPDPSGKNQQRFWDGDGWTEYYQPLAPAEPEVHGAQTATEDYPYLTRARGEMTTPDIPPPEGWQTTTHDWNTSAPASTWTAPQSPTAWGTPANPQSGLPGVYHPPQPSWGAHDSTGSDDSSTQVLRTGTQSAGRANRWGVIAIVVVALLLVGLLIAGGIMAFQGSDAGDEPTAAETGVIDPSGLTSGNVPRNGEWVGELTINDGGAYLIDARSTDGGDLQMALREAGGGATLSYNDDRGNLVRMGADHLDPLLAVSLEPGDHEVILSEHRSDSSSFELSLTRVSEQVDPDDRLSARVERDDAYLATLELDDDSVTSIAVQAIDGGDPTLTVYSLERDVHWHDDDGGSGLDPLLESVELDAGSYLVVIAEYSGRDMTVDIDVSTQ